MDLFPTLPQTLSPRLQWMKAHKITTTLRPVSEYVVSEDEVWLAHLPIPHTYGRGKTEDEALTALAKSAGIKLWMEEGV